MRRRRVFGYYVERAREHRQRECWCGINHEYERRIADHGTNTPAAARGPKTETAKPKALR